MRQEVVEHNVVRDLARDDRPGAQRKSEPRYLSADELERLLARMGDTFRPIAATCACAGLRLSEALGLRWRDVAFADGTPTVSAQLGPDGTRSPLKTAASAATVPLLPKLAAELRAHRSRVAGQALARVQPDALVFTASRGRPHSRRNVLRAVYAAGDAAGLNGEGRDGLAFTNMTCATASLHWRSRPASHCRRPPRSLATRTRASRRPSTRGSRMRRTPASGRSSPPRSGSRAPAGVSWPTRSTHRSASR